MAKEKKELYRPVMNALTCMGVAGISSIVANYTGAGLAGLAGSTLLTLVNGITGNIASDQFLKIDNKGLYRWWKRKGPDLSNHDLYFALQKSVIDALRATEAQFLEEDIILEKRTKKVIHLKVEALCSLVENDFLDFFGDNLTDKDILFYGENVLDLQDSALAHFFNEDDLDTAGADFGNYLFATFPSKLIQAFTEQLKTNQRVWVAYQRLILQETQQQVTQNFGLTQDLVAKVDALSTAFVSAGVLYESNVPGLAEQFIQSNESIKECWQRAQEDLNQLLKEMGQAQREFITSWKQSREKDDAFQEKALEGIAELHKKMDLLGNSNEMPEEQILINYLEWIQEHYKYITLPTIPEQGNLPPMLLERVYVALRLLDAKVLQEMLFSSELINTKIAERLENEAKEPNETEISRIRAELIQENPMLGSITQIQNAGSGNKNQSVNLAQAFQSFRHLVILGDPGSGKSTLAKWLMLKLSHGLLDHQITKQNETRVALDEVEIIRKDATSLAETPDSSESATINLGPPRLPLLIRVTDYFNYFKSFSYNPAHPEIGRGIIDFIGMHLPTIPNISHQQIKRMVISFLEQGRAIIILDGLDEIVGDRTSINNEILDFTNNWITFGNIKNGISPDLSPGEIGGNQIIITSRIVGYHTTPLPEQFSKVFIEKMDDPAVAHFCEVWTRLILEQEEQSKTLTEEALNESILLQSNDLKSAILNPNRPQVRELATNPLLVTILAILFRYHKGQLPETRVELYERSVNILIEKWRVDKRYKISTDEIKKLMAALAAYIHASTSEDITESVLKNILEKELCYMKRENPLHGIPQEISTLAERILDMIRSDVGLLSERGGNIYHFLHRTFQEYLAGQHLLRDEHKAPMEIIDRIADPIWREPIVLALGYANQEWPPEKFDQLLTEILEVDDEIKDLIPRTILLLAIALPEMERLSTDNFKKIL
ncbi:MAG: hypothetical protein IPL65_22565 [Lewinellaceae bacterium]|nr:hypothetical protein [Lewinellaceae bacterium]